MFPSLFKRLLIAVSSWTVSTLSPTAYIWIGTRRNTDPDNFPTLSGPSQLHHSHDIWKLRGELIKERVYFFKRVVRVMEFCVDGGEIQRIS